MISNRWDGAYEMSCTVCMERNVIKPPVSINMALVMMRQFRKEHRHPTHKANTANEEDDE